MLFVVLCGYSLVVGVVVWCCVCRVSFLLLWRCLFLVEVVCRCHRRFVIDGVVVVCGLLLFGVCCLRLVVVCCLLAVFILFVD